MFEWWWRIKSKIAEIFDKIPGPPDIILDKAFQDKVKSEANVEELCIPRKDGTCEPLPDDFDDIKLEKEYHAYNLKLANVPPQQWKVLGRNLLNMAYADPQYGKKCDDDTDDEDPLPPPPEPTEYMKSLKYPLISVKAENIDVDCLEELGDLFYDCADYMEMGENGRPMCNPPTDDTHPLEVEALQDQYYDAEKEIRKDLTKEFFLTNSDLIPGAESKPYQDDNADWEELVNQNAPCSDDDDDLEEFTI